MYSSKNPKKSYKGFQKTKILSSKQQVSNTDNKSAYC